MSQKDRSDSHYRHGNCTKLHNYIGTSIQYIPCVYYRCIFDTYKNKFLNVSTIHTPSTIIQYSAAVCA